MLLFIVLANSHYFLRGSLVLGGYPQDGSTIDAAVTWLISTFVDGRAFPMFGLLFGYGVAQIVRRQEALGPRAVRRLLWRRSVVLVVVGFLHAVLLYAGDMDAPDRPARAVRGVDPAVHLPAAAQGPVALLLLRGPA